MENTSSSNPTSWLTIGSIIIIVLALVIFWHYSPENENTPAAPNVVQDLNQLNKPLESDLEEEKIVQQVESKQALDETIAIEQTKEETIEEVVEAELPSLTESDNWLKQKLPSLTWRKELLKLLVDNDMIRRLVVFTDNFSQGIIAYEHSLLVKPKTAFSAREIEREGSTVLKWNENSSRRFSLYVDLLRSFDSETLISWYFQLKPLIDQAYKELGYNEVDFTDTLQDAITKVLDMDIPKSSLELVRPNVVYQFKDTSIEELDDVEKFMLRLGKENLLVIKSVLLEINEKLSRGVS